MFSIFKTLHPPTGIENAVSAYFLSPYEKNLVLSSGNQLYVYRLVPDTITNDFVSESVNHILNDPADVYQSLSSQKPQRLKFECMNTFTLWSNICSITPCRFGPTMVKDALFISFMDAKLALIEFDTTIHDLKTLSMHYFEDELQKEGQWYNFSPPIVRVDPDMRCAVMLIYNCKLVIIPFFNNENSNKDITLTNEMLSNNSMLNITIGPSTNTRCSSLSSYIVHLKKLDPSLTGRIIDLQFLHGYYEPTLFILCETNRTWVGRVAVKKDTCCSVALSINVQQKSNPVIWPVDKLPFDCFSCMSVPKPIGGILIIAVNSIIYLNQSIPPYGVSLNTLTKESTKYPLRQMNDLKISLDCCQATFISSEKIVLSLKNGEIYVLTLHTDTMRSVKEFTFDRAAAGVLSSCICKCDEGFLFFGSRLGNSLLLRYHKKIIDETSEAIMANGLVDTSSNDTATIATTTIKAENGATNHHLDDDMLMYGNNNIENIKTIDNNTGEPYTKRVKQESDDTDIVNDQYDTDNSDEKKPLTYTFDFCDSIINIGPCGNSICGESADFNQQDENIFHQNSLSLHLDLVTTSGHGKNGSISILQQTLKPHIITTQQLSGSVDLWTVYSTPMDTKQHAYLIISNETSTLILQTGTEISELEHGGFLVHEQTIYCGNIGRTTKLIVQITRYSIVLLRDSVHIQTITLDNEQQQASTGSKTLGPIRFATSLDKYLAILTAHGQVYIFSLNNEQTTAPHLAECFNLTSKKYSCVNLYIDHNGLFTMNVEEKYLKIEQVLMNRRSISTVTPTSAQPMPPLVGKPAHSKTSFDSSFMVGGDDEDDWLYGKKIELGVTSISQTVNEQHQNDADVSMSGETKDRNTHSTKTSVNKSYWLITTGKDGTLTIYDLDTFIIRFEIVQFNSALKVLVDVKDTYPPATNYLGKIDTSCSAYVYEIIMIGLGYRKDRVYLLARIDEDLILYEAYPYYHLPEDRLKIRFRRLSLNAFIRTKKSSAKRNTTKKQQQQQQQTQSQSTVQQKDQLKTTTPVQTDLIDDEMNEYQRTLLRSFDDVSNYSGIFICGTHPHWLIWSKGNIRSFPMTIDGPIKAFAQFNDENCKKGFLYFNQKDDLRIAVMPTQRILDSYWPLQKITLRMTVHYLCYHVESKLYAATMSIDEPTNQLVQPSGEDRESITYTKESNFLLPSREQFIVQLFSPTQWEQIPNAKITMNDWEHVTCMKTIALKFQGALMKTYIAIGTANCFNEDVNSRGRIILFDIIEVVPELNQPLTKHKIKIVHDREEKGPVTALESVVGYLIGAVGQKVYIWQFKDDQLKGIAFVDIQVYCHRMIAMKNYILIADVHKSIALLRYQEDMRVLSYVSRDSRKLDVYTTEFFVDQTHIKFVTTDADKNLYIYSHSPIQKETAGGTWLARKSEFHVGCHIMSAVRLQVNTNNLSTKQNYEGKQALIMPTLDGGITCLLPLNEKIFRRLGMLQNSMTSMFPHYCGLNPKSFRACKTRMKELENSQKNTLDGDLLWKYFDLSFIERNELLSRLGMTSDQFHEDLTDILRTLTLF